MGSTANIAIGGAVLQIDGNDGTLDDVGYIKDGIVITPSFETYRVEGIEGVTGCVAARHTKSEYTVKSTLMEPTLINIQKAWDLYTGVTTDPSGTLDITAASTVHEREISITANRTSAPLTRTILFYRCIVESPNEMKMTDFEETKLPITFICMYDSTHTSIGLITDNS